MWINSVVLCIPRGIRWFARALPLHITSFVSAIHHALLHSNRTVMKSGSEMVRVGLRTFFENAAEDLEKTFENLKLGKFTHSRSQMKGVSQNINYTTVALLPILTALFEHITQHHFGVDLLCESWQLENDSLLFKRLQKAGVKCQFTLLCKTMIAGFSYWQHHAK